ncbi:hypothetical protein BOX15_Mlig011527g1 [Macrostomum lignano]|uniref:SUEL-type lectin domain-containing protein n=1 Tax=Macrostomum lignano TaxID=282301 RepID=A0A267E4Q3_9PLAT|nr:hypothetical protein BOX15_Mlig011527g1 [Macrostomum lignano]
MSLLQPAEVALALALVSALVLALCPAGGSAVAVYTSDASDEKDAHCRVGYYIHDSADLLSSVRNCPPKLDCRLLRPDVPQEEISCKMEHLGSPREFPYFGRPDYSAKNLFKFSCSSQYECGYRQSSELCYHSSKVLALAKDNPSSLLLTRPTDAAIVCA